MEYPKNFGLIHSSPPVGAWMFGDLTGVSERTCLQPDRSWISYLPLFERQYASGFDSMACVTFSALNCLEALAERSGIEVNYSDRFTAKASGTSKEGNTLYAVAESIRKTHGLVLEEHWPLVTSWNEYYKEPPIALFQEGQTFLSNRTVSYEYVTPDAETLWDALQYAPVQVAIYAYPPTVDGIYPRSTNRCNHAVMLCGGSYGQYFFIYDHYEVAIKKIAWNTMFWGAVLYSMTSKFMFKENTLYQLVDAPGGFYLYAGGMLRQDSLDKILASWIVRNGGATTGKVGTLTKLDLEGVDIFDLKGKYV